jgi:hypothetical protein
MGNNTDETLAPQQNAPHARGIAWSLGKKCQI